jgi:hypothetical protein
MPNGTVFKLVYFILIDVTSVGMARLDRNYIYCCCDVTNSIGTFAIIIVVYRDRIYASCIASITIIQTLALDIFVTIQILLMTS